MDEKDIKPALICLQSLGLTESESTLEAFMDCDPNAFYVAVTQTDDRVIGVCGAPIVSHSTGFVGIFGVHQSLQNRKIGQKLLKLCLEHIGDNNCGLFTLPNKSHIFENFYGFKVKDFKQLLVFAGIPRNIDNINVFVDQSLEVKKLRTEDTNLLTKIIEFDRRVHSIERQQLLTHTLNKSDYKTYAIIDKRSDQLLGYGSIRTNIDGVGLIGPVYADNDSIAEILVYRLIKDCETSQTNGLLYPTFNCCESSHRIPRTLRLQQFNYSQTLFTKYRPPLNHRLIYCIHSPNFVF